MKRLTVPLYGLQCYVTSNKALAMKRWGLEEDELSKARGMAGELDTNGASAFFVYISPDYVKCLDTISHEATHLANYVLSAVGVQTDQDNDEALAYLVGWATKAISKEVSDGKKRKRTAR